MAQLLDIDANTRGNASVSRALTARAITGRRADRPGDAVAYRDLGADPVPHVDSMGRLARQVPPDQRSPAQAASSSLTELLVSKGAAVKPAMSELIPLAEQSHRWTEAAIGGFRGPAAAHT